MLKHMLLYAPFTEAAHILFASLTSSFCYRLACSVGVNEENYVFLKKLCQVLTGLGGQLCALWVSCYCQISNNSQIADRGRIK